MTRAGSATRRGYGADWRKIRRVVLERDGFVCHWCFAPANTVDHVRPLALAGERLDPANLVAACRSCNSRRGAAVANRRRSSLTPGSGYLVPMRHPVTGRFMAGDCERDCLTHCAGMCGVVADRPKVCRP